MSHIVQIQTEIRDAAGVRAACQRMKLAEPVHGKTRLFSGQVEGLAVQLPDWRYPVVCGLTNGHLHFDNYNGRWGDQKHLDRFQQLYAIEKARIEARKRGHSITEQSLADGSVKLTVQVSGSAT